MSSSNFYDDANQIQAPAAGQRPQYDLRPLSTGEILDRTFQIYRSHFILFAGLALLPAAANVVTSVLRLVSAAQLDRRVHVGAALYLAQFITGISLIISAVLLIVLYGITQAATTWAVSAVYLGEEASIRAAYGVAFKHWFRYTLIRLRQLWAAMWLPMVLIMAAVAFMSFGRRSSTFTWISIALFVCVGLSLIYSVWAYIRISLAVPASVVESLRTRPALKRSTQLLASRKIRIFLLFLLLLALYMVVLMIQSPVLFLTLRSRGAHMFVSQALNLGIGFVATTLIGPVGAIGLCLFYFDERVRREGFDIEWMMMKLAPALAPTEQAPTEQAPAAPHTDAASQPLPIEAQQNPEEPS
ncbi:MAG TPA: hypothetical protein VMU92_14085 [Acidobacteriaceae bacterium]|nr:hypothetical protein [Acidobacteriaceae bacterium]